MSRQTIPDVDLIVVFKDQTTLQSRHSYRGRGRFVETDREDRRSTFKFIVDPVDRNRKNPIIYQGLEVTCRLMKNGRYCARFFIDPTRDTIESQQRVIYETKVAFSTVVADCITREVNNAV